MSDAVVYVVMCGEVRLKLFKQKLWRSVNSKKCGGHRIKCGGHRKSVVEITIPYFL